MSVVLALARIRERASRKELPDKDCRKLELVPPLVELTSALAATLPAREEQHRLLASWTPGSLAVQRSGREAKVSGAACKAVLRGLRSRQQAGTGHCWPAESTLAGESGLSVRTVRLALNALVGAGILIVVRAGGGRARPTVSRIAWARLSPKPGTECRECNPELSAGNRTKPGTVHPKPGTECRRSLKNIETKKTGRTSGKRSRGTDDGKLPPHPDTRRLAMGFRALVAEHGTAPTPATLGADLAAARQLLEVVTADEALRMVGALLRGARCDRDGFHRGNLLGGLRYLQRNLPKLASLLRGSDELPVGCDEERMRRFREMDACPAADEVAS